ncbi:MAG: hypothetical protein AAF575_02420 [Bacteroidota bacterium]
MKKLVVYSFVLLYLVAMMRPILPLMEYVIYEDYIAEFLCINKKNTSLECKGKCYLMQRLQEQNDQKEQGIPKIAMEEYPIGFVQFLIFASEVFESPQTKGQFRYMEPYSYLFTPNSFHPPSKLS